MDAYRSLLLLAAFIGAGPAAALTPTVRAQAPATQAPASPQPAPTRALLSRNLSAGFKSIDTDGDGVLSQAELAAAEAKEQKKRFAVVRARAAQAFDKLDSNHDGTLSKAEFMAAAPQAPGASPNGAELLSQLDKNRDSKVSVDEYRAPILSRFDRLDTNHDGSLSPAERQAHQSTKS